MEDSLDAMVLVDTSLLVFQFTVFASDLYVQNSYNGGEIPEHSEKDDETIPVAQQVGVV